MISIIQPGMVTNIIKCIIISSLDQFIIDTLGNKIK
jgi:hypothetical protein